MGIKILTS